MLSSYVINGTAAADTWSVVVDAGQITVNGTTSSVPSLTDVQINGSDGNDTLFVTHASVPVVFNGGNNNDQLFLSTTGHMSDEITAKVSFNGGAGTDSVDYRDENFLSGAGEYGFSASSFAFGTVTASWDSAVENLTLYTGSAGAEIAVKDLSFPVNIVVNGNSGSDDMLVGMSGGSGTVGFAGGNGAGIDTLDVLDTTVIGPITYSITASVVSRSGRTINYAGVESLELDGVSASTGTYNVSGVNPAMSLTLIGGNASDNFALTATQYGNTTIDGAGGTFNTMVLDDRTQAAAIFRANIDTATFGRDYESQTFALSFPNIQAWTYYASNSTTIINVYGTSSLIPSGQQATILCGTNSDTVVLHPHDASGNLTINGNLGVSGGLGSDTVIVDDVGSPGAINYAFSNPFGAGTQNIFGMGTRGFGAASDVETIDVRAGEGEDTFTLNTWQSGAALFVNSGGGYDTFDISPTAHSLPVAITNMAYFSYDGAGGDDHFDVNNDSNTSAWTITRDAYTLSYSTSGYSRTFYLAHLGYLYASGGTQNDQYFITSAPADNMNNAFAGAGGNDTYTFGNAGLTSGIASYCSVGGDVGTDSIVIDDSADTVARKFHINQYWINTVPGDTLFPAAGGDIYGLVAPENVTGTITVKLGSGADTVFFAPVPSGTYSIRGNNPTSSPGDSLILALADVTNPVFTPLGTGAGSYTFSNRASFSYTGIETKAQDTIAPTIIATQYNYDSLSGSLPSVDFQYSEPVDEGLYNTHFFVYNTTTAQDYDYGTWAYTYDAGTNIIHYTFPYIAGGVLPDGNYTAYTSRVTDEAGNLMTPYTASFDFFVLTADANHDRSVDTVDFNILAANFGQSDKMFGQGDFNYDGSVDTVDFNLLAGKFGQTLAGPAASTSAALPADPGVVTAGVFSTVQVDSGKDSLEILV